jgi:hypothetical protein
MPTREATMAEYLLNDKQRQLLRALVPKLKQAKIGLVWHVVHGASITAIFENGKINLRSLGWHKADHRDLDQFVDQGFFQVIKQSHQRQPMTYSLNGTFIIQTVENGFLLPTPIAA